MQRIATYRHRLKQQTQVIRGLKDRAETCEERAEAALESAWEDCTDDLDELLALVVEYEATGAGCDAAAANMSCDTIKECEDGDQLHGATYKIKEGDSTKA